jgi:hypothetical protein
MPLKHGALSGRARARQRLKASLGTLLALTIRGGWRHARLLESSTVPMLGTVPLGRAGGADARRTIGERTKGEKSGTRIGMVDETCHLGKSIQPDGMGTRRLLRRP